MEVLSKRFSCILKNYFYSIVTLFYMTKKKEQIKNLFLPFQYPEPGSNRHSIATTGV
jgi:hypothetical protein